MAKRKKDLDLTPNKEALEVIKKDLLAWESLSFPNPTKILAIDPGTANLGICLLETGRGQHVVTTSKIDLPKFENIASRVNYVQEVVTLWIEHHRPDIFVKEGPIFPSTGKPGQPNFLIYGLIDSARVQYALEAVAIKEFVQLITIAPTTMRAFLKSKTKSDTKLQIFKLYGIEVPSEDEADACGLAFCGQAIANGAYVVTKAVKKPRKKKVAE